MISITMWVRIINAKIVIEYYTEENKWEAFILKGERRKALIEDEESKEEDKSYKEVIGVGDLPQVALENLCKELAGKNVKFGSSTASEESNFVPEELTC